jgi:hypothetical protein
MQFDQANVLSPRVALNTATIATSTTTNGVIIDTQGYNALTFLLSVGARTDGTFTPNIQHGDDPALSDASTPAADDLVGTSAGAAINTAQTVKKLGYVGNKRYVRLAVASTTVTSGATVGATAVLGRPDVGPAA